MKLRGNDLYLMDNPTATLGAIGRDLNRSPSVEYLGECIYVYRRSAPIMYYVAATNQCHERPQDAIADIDAYDAGKKWPDVAVDLLRIIQEHEANPGRLTLDLALDEIANKFGLHVLGEAKRRLKGEF